MQSIDRIDSDTDGDGLSDNVEVNGEVNRYVRYETEDDPTSPYYFHLGGPRKNKTFTITTNPRCANLTSRFVKEPADERIIIQAASIGEMYWFAITDKYWTSEGWDDHLAFMSYNTHNEEGKHCQDPDKGFIYVSYRPLDALCISERLQLAHQQITHEWWAASQNEFDFFISEIVLEEIARGDRAASSKRLAFVQHIPILDLTDDIEPIARIYAEDLAMPDRAFGDALHLAIACVHQIDYMVTWNCAHLANGRTIKRLNELNRRLNLYHTTICTPEELMTGEDYDQ